MKKYLTNSLVEFNYKNTVNEEDSWLKFLDKQVVNKTVLGGGFKPIEFERSNESINPIKGIHSHNYSSNFLSYGHINKKAYNQNLSNSLDEYEDCKYSVFA